MTQPHVKMFFKYCLAIAVAAIVFSVPGSSIIFNTFPQQIKNLAAKLNQNDSYATINGPYGYPDVQGDSDCVINTAKYQGCASVTLIQYAIENAAPSAFVLVSWNIRFENLRTLPITVGITNSIGYYTKELEAPMYAIDIPYDISTNIVTSLSIQGMTCDQRQTEPTVFDCKLEALAP